jgi:hypothetical protein
MRECAYTITVKFAEDFELHEGKKITSELGKDETKIYTFFVPDDREINSILIDLGVFGNTNQVKMYATIIKDENTRPDNMNTISVIPSWFGLSARAYQGNSYEFCRNCWYKVMISSNKEISYTLHYHTSKAVTRIKEKFFASYELVLYGERNCYEYLVDNPEEILEVSVNTFSGDPDIYVNPGTLPTRKDEFAFRTSGDLDETLIIEPQQRREHNALTGKYYICIYGALTSSYGFIFSSTEQNEMAKEYIYSGLTRTSQVKKDQLKTFTFLLYHEDKTNITFTLTSLSGNADLYIVLCVESLDDYGFSINECSLTKDKLGAPEVYNSEMISSVDVITFQYDPKECLAVNKQCSYIVGVLGKVDSRFALSVTTDESVEIPLIEGRPMYGYVGHKQNSYYTFVVNDPKTENIKIQLTSLSGDADLFVNRFKRGSKTEFEKFSNNIAYMPDTITFTKAEHGVLNASYHITVYGETSATFTVMFITDAPSIKQKAILLMDGTPQTISINDTEGELCYFHAPSVKQNIKLQVIPIVGSYMVYIGANFIPTEKNFTWMMNIYDNDIEILGTDENYITSGKYYVLLHKSIKSDSTPYISIVKFTTGSYHTTIVESQPELGRLVQAEVKYYRYNVVSRTGSITVLTTPFSGDPDLYISISSNNDKPSLGQSDYSALAVGADYIRIPLEEILMKNPNCAADRFTTTGCSVYIGVRCASEICTYNLQVGRSSEFIMNLVDGFPQFGVTYDKDPQYYVYKPGSTEGTTIISIYPKHDAVKAFVSLASESQRDDIKPSATRKDLETFNRANMAILIIPQEAKNQCGNYCRYYIGVYGDETSGGSKEREFTIVVSSSVRQLVEGQTIVDYVDSRKYRYYRFDAPYENCTLSISVTPLSAGDPDLFVNRGRGRLPDKDNADFKSIAYRGDLLQIPVEASGRQQWRHSFLIAVYGSQNSTYSLTLTTSTSIIHELNQGVPARQEQAARTIHYFIFHSWRKADIAISLTMRSGRVTIRANVIESAREVNILDKLPSAEATSTWSSLRKNTLNYLLIGSTDSKYKQEGTYLIAVEAEESSSYDIMIEYESNEDYKLLKLSESYRVTLNEKAEKRFKFELDSYDDVKVAINSFYGLVEGTIATTKDGDAKWRITDNGVVIIKGDDAKFRMGTFYLVLKAKRSTDFILTVEYDKDPMWLSEGLPTSSKAKKDMPAYFYYSIPKNVKDEDLTMNVYVTLPEKSFMNPRMYIRHITKDDSRKPDSKYYDYRANWDPDVKQLGISVEVNTKKSSTLVIAVTTESSQSADFGIMAWTSGFALLTLDHLYSNKFYSTGDVHVYQLTVTSTPRVYIEVIPCLGEVEFFVSKNIANINDRKYDLKKAEMAKGKLFGALEKPSGIYYISVRSIGISNTTRYGQYTIRAFKTSSGSAENLEDFSLGSYGNIQMTYDNNKVTLNWGAPYLRGSFTPLDKVTYSVYMSADREENLNTICGIKYGNAEKIKTDIRETGAEYVLKRKKGVTQYTFNVLATMHGFNTTLAYNPITLQVLRDARPRSRTFMIVAGVAIIGLGIAAIYFWRKYKAAIKELHYEMNDVRNLGNISAGREMSADRAETYQHLRIGGED